MQFTLEPIQDTDADLSAWLDVLLAANSNLPPNDYRTVYTNALWPNHHTPEMHAIAKSQLAALPSKLPPGSWISKAVETASNAFAGVAVWVNKSSAPAALAAQTEAGASYSYANTSADYYADNTCAKALVAHANAVTDKHTAEIDRQVRGPHITLRSLAVHPRFQRRGIGSLLVGEGTRYADDVGATITLDATVDGEVIYARHGFFREGRVVLEMTEELRMYPTLYLVSMRRVPEGKMEIRKLSG